MRQSKDVRMELVQWTDRKRGRTMTVWQPRKRVMTSVIEESNACLLEKVKGPRRAMIETIKPRRMHAAC